MIGKNFTAYLDNRPNPLVTPGKVVNKMDFLYYSGLYRNVWLHVNNPLHITDANTVDRPGGGGIFVTYPVVNDAKAQISIRTNVINESSDNTSFALMQELVDGSGRVMASSLHTGKQLAGSKDAHYTMRLTVSQPKLWSPDVPNLYTLRTSVLSSGKKVDVKNTKIGIRSFSISKETGLLVNGKPVRIVGSNRHMNYPWIGNALSNNANIRDAILVKNAGMNCLRLAHYPQAPSFYDACDSLGILLLDCVPGWQFFNKNPSFLSQSFDDIRQTIRRDRNHPSILFWEVSLNESYPPSDYRCQQVAVAKSEWPSGLNFYTSGDSYFTKACYDVPYDDWGENLEARNNTTYPDNAFLIREYGDFEFGGTRSTTRQLRANGEKGLLQQAWNLQWEHNRNRQLYPRCLGDLTWEFVDGISGYIPGIQGWGVVDIKRLPKFSYYFFQSQVRDESKSMCFIANYWTHSDTVRNVVVYSNCDEVELWCNNRAIERRRPDDGPDTHYGTVLDQGGDPFGGGDARSLASPPFTFKNISFSPGELKAVGYKNGVQVASHSVYTPGQPYKMVLSAATNGIPLNSDGVDVVFIHAQILDSNDHPVPTARNKVQFRVQGDAKIISPSDVNAEAGIGTVLLQGGTKHGEVIITAMANGIASATLSIKK